MFYFILFRSNFVLMLKAIKNNHENIFNVMIWSEYNKERVLKNIH